MYGCVCDFRSFSFDISLWDLVTRALDSFVACDRLSRANDRKCMMHVDSKKRNAYGETQMHNAREATVVSSLLGNLLLKSVFIDP